MSTVSNTAANDSAKVWSIRFLLFIAGLGGLLYGIDVGIIAGALPYLEATSGLNSNELSYVVAAVLLGSVISTLFAGAMADWMGRKKMMALSGFLFVLSIPLIALAQGFGPLVMGRLLQGISAGLIGVVVPLYLAECLSAATRGKGTGIFQWLLTLGIVAAALIAIFFSMWLENVKELGDAQKLFDAQDLAWRCIFWVSLPPGVLFVIGSFMVAESPRWLFRKRRKNEALAALLRSRSQADADLEMKEMEDAELAEKSKTSTGNKVKESLLRRKYVVPFLLACVILACNQATGVNSIIGYHATILIQAGLSDVQAHWGYVILTSVNFFVTMLGVMLVDRKGRKFLLSIGSAGIILSLVCVGYVFHQTEKSRVDCREAVQAMVTDYQDISVSFAPDGTKETEMTITIDGNVVEKASSEVNLTLVLKHSIARAKFENDAKKKTASVLVVFDADEKGQSQELKIEVENKFIGGVATQGNILQLVSRKKIDKVKLGDKDQRIFLKFNGEKSKDLLQTAGDLGMSFADQPATMILIYSFGDFRAASKVVRSDDESAKPLEIRRSDCVPANGVKAFFSNPFASLSAAKTAPLQIENALITPVPSESSGWLTAFFTFSFMAFFAVGPGVCVWLALSELMPTRIRSNGMSIALLINQAVSTSIAAVFLPTVGKYGYSTMFFGFAGFTVIYFVTAAFFLPETKGKTLEEIEEHFSGKK